MATTGSTLTASGITLSDDTIRKQIQSAGIYNITNADLHSKFARFGHIDPWNRFPVTREYVFFTKPDLHIFKDGADTVLNPELQNMPIFVDALSRIPYTLRALQYSVDTVYPFINILTNTKISNLDLPGLTAGEVETSSNLYGTKMTYRKDSISSDEAFDFSLEFEDTKRMEVYMLFKLFDEYERKKFNGKVTPPNVSYTLNKILHDQISIYKFIVADDGETIMHYAKLYGCYPKTTPRDVFSDLPADGGLKLTIQWTSQFVEDMEPNIIRDFNTLAANASKTSNTPVSTYDGTIGSVNGDLVSCPYIEIQNGTTYPKIVYKLRWKA